MNNTTHSITPSNNQSEPTISVDELFGFVLQTYEGVVLNNNWGERGLFYNPHGKLAKGVYIMTAKEKDGANDKASQVDRPNTYRLNLGISKASFQSLFGSIPKRPAAGCIVDTGHDFTAVDTITPHPVYGWMSWIAVVNPSQATIEILKPYIEEAVQLAKGKYAKKKLG